MTRDRRTEGHGTTAFTACVAGILPACGAGPAGAETIDEEASESLTPVLMNRGGLLRFTLKNGRTVTVEVADAGIDGGCVPVPGSEMDGIAALAAVALLAGCLQRQGRGRP